MNGKNKNHLLKWIIMRSNSDQAREIWASFRRKFPHRLLNTWAVKSFSDFTNALKAKIFILTVRTSEFALTEHANRAKIKVWGRAHERVTETMDTSWLVSRSCLQTLPKKKTGYRHLCQTTRNICNFLWHWTKPECEVKTRRNHR